MQKNAWAFMSQCRHVRKKKKILLLAENYFFFFLFRYVYFEDIKYTWLYLSVANLNVCKHNLVLLLNFLCAHFIWNLLLMNFSAKMIFSISFWFQNLLIWKVGINFYYIWINILEQAKYTIFHEILILHSQTL